jgi:hypothetical protein
MTAGVEVTAAATHGGYIDAVAVAAMFVDASYQRPVDVRRPAPWRSAGIGGWRG